MSATSLPSLQLTRLLAKGGHLHEARASAEDARLDALILEDRSQWLEATRIYFQCCQELEETAEAKKYLLEVVDFLETTPASSLRAQTQTLLASWLLATDKSTEAQNLAQTAITLATQLRDLETLARALAILAFSYSLSVETFENSWSQLDKLDLILSEIDLPEITLTAKNLRGYLLTQKNELDLALKVLWEAYEFAKIKGFYFHTSSLLAQIARVYRDKKQYEEATLYSELAIKGLDRNKAPRLYKQIEKSFPASQEKKSRHFDFQVNEGARRMREKTIGSIDFRNQHLLFEMALLFIKNPGIRWNKEQLALEVWSQTYSPELHDNLIYVSIKRLRTLLEPNIENPQYILRDRKGYYFNSQALVQFKNSEERPTL